MSAQENLEDWLLDKWGDLGELKQNGVPLDPVVDLLSRFCFVDYCMRNAGDLANLEDPPGVDAFLETAATDARALGLNRTEVLFLLARADLEKTYFDHFADVCRELREAADV